MQISQAYVAAKHTESILNWVHTVDDVDRVYLRKLFDEIYKSEDRYRQYALRNGSYEVWKDITFDGVYLAYRHFHDGKAHHFEAIKKYLNELGPPETWLALGRREPDD